MAYDFTTRVDRSQSGAVKWKLMDQQKPDHSPGIFPLSVADMELKNPPEVIEGLKQYLDNCILGYPGPNAAYYEAVMGWMERRLHYPIKQEWIVCTAGVVTAVYAAIEALTKPGDGIIIFRPVYYPFSNAIEARDRRIVNVPLLRSGLDYSIDFEGFEREAAKAENTMLVFSNPHNPVGRVWTPAELKRLGEICLKHNIYIVSDEIWADLMMPGYTHTVFATVMPELESILLTCTAPSKTFNLAGLATSNIIIENEDIRQRYQAALRSFHATMVNILGYEACRIAYTSCEPWLEELLALFDRNNRLVCDFFASKHPEIIPCRLEGTYLQWIDFSALNLDREALERFMVDDCEWFTDPGYYFGDEGDGYIRIILAVPTSVLEEALERLDKGLAKLKAKA